MVKGLDHFKRHFNSYKENYVLIGGTACLLAMEEAGLSFRATKDLDIVLSIEVKHNEFIKAFQEFINAGKYKSWQKSSGKKVFYRFHSPEDTAYPHMLELFSRKHDLITVFKGSKFTPIPVDEEMISLSAIMLDEAYYPFIIQGKCEINGLSTLKPGYLIPLKAKAWLNLSANNADEKDIRKHKNDIIRLYQLLPINRPILLPETIKQDLQQFLIELKNTPPDFKALGLKNTTIQEVLTNFGLIYDAPMI